MKPRYVFLFLLATLLIASCGIVPSVTEVTMLAGETTTITITELRWFSGSMIPIGGVSVVSTDPGILRIEQDPSLSSASVTLHALQPGTAYIQATNLSQRLVTVHIAACEPVSVRPQVTQVQALVGSPVQLRVITDGPYPIDIIWYEERRGSWSQIPFATGNVYPFTPKTSGTFRFEAVYSDRCGEASAIITVVASTRVHAVRH